MLQIPDDEDKLPGWIREIADECMRSASDRAAYYRMMESYYHQGSDGEARARYNAVRPQVDRTAGYLYASHSVLFRTSLQGNAGRDAEEMSAAFSDVLTTEFERSDLDLEFAEATRISLIKGAAIIKMRPDGFGVCGDVLDPLCFGVMRESITELSEQEAICQISRPTVSELWEMAGGGDKDRRRGADRLVERIKASHDEGDDGGPGPYTVLLGQIDPLGQPNVAPTGQASIGFSGAPPALRPSSKRQLCELVELWVRDPDRGGDWTTLQMVYPDIVILGALRRRNIFGVEGHTPFCLVQPRKRPGSFFGESMIEDIAPLQDDLSMKLDGLARRWKRNIKPPMGFSGAEGNIPESWDVMDNNIGGFMVDLGPQGKAEQLSQPVSPQELEDVNWILQAIERQSGFAPVLMGQGESGVRSQGHAGTLVRTASPPLLRMAARTERQLTDAGYLAARVLQEQDPRTYKTESGADFRLKEVTDFGVKVDAHSASPAFSDLAREDALLLAQSHAIGPADLIELLHPPHAKLMLERLKVREAKAEQMQAAEAQQKAQMHAAPHKKG